MAASPDQPHIAVISADQGLIEHIGDAAAAAGCRIAVGAAAVSGARAVLIGIDAAPGLLRDGVPRSADAVVVGGDAQAPQVWRMASDLGTAGAVSLPAGSPWLVQWLHARATGRPAGSSIVAAVFGAAGGVGASTLSAGLAVTAAGWGLRSLLIDAHPGPAGVDLLLGETAPPDHWSRFAGIRGFLPPEALATLPVLEGVRCLGWGGGAEQPLWQGALGSVLVAAGRDHDLVVLDAGGHPVSLEELPRRSRPILLAPASWRGVLAAQSRLGVLCEAFDGEPVVVLRDIGGRGNPRGWAAEFPGTEVLLLGFDPRVMDDEEQCRPPGTRPRSAVGRLCRTLLATIAERPAAA